MIRDLGYRCYRPGGYTDDLGIIADRNQWVSEQKPGWYVFVGRDDYGDVMEWLSHGSIVFDKMHGDPNMLILDDRNTVTEMMLRWA